MPAKRRVLVTAGWSELIDLPLWGVQGLPAKLDTGARSSALHVENMVEVGRSKVAFDVLLHGKAHDRRVHVVAPVTRRAKVRSSTGHYWTRVFVRTDFKLGETERSIEISLVDRSDMRFDMLIGRTALQGCFLVDSGRRRVLSKKRKARR